MVDKQIISKKEELLKRESVLHAKERRLSNVRLALFVILIAAVICAWRMEEMRLGFSVASLLFLAAFVFLVAIHTKVAEENECVKRCLMITEQYESRENGKWRAFNETGEEFITEQNEEVVDLNLLGKNSVFQMLNISRTRSGKRNLALELTEPLFDKDCLLDKQQAIKEIVDKYDFAMNFQEKMSRIKPISDMDLEEDNLFHENKKPVRALAMTIGIVLAVAVYVTLFLALCHVVGFTWFAYVWIASLAYNHFYALIMREEFAQATLFTRLFGRFENVCDEVLNQPFESKKNIELFNKIAAGRHIMHKIARVSALFKCKENWLSYLIFNPLFSLNSVLLFMYRKTVEEQNGQLKDSLLALEEFEKLIALTGIAWVKQNVCMPELLDEVKLEINHVCHPLINEDKCVANSFSCGNPIVIITGSNMSGKTSFMRTIGINLSLMYAGTYVNAESFSAPFLKLATSISVQDDISRGISTFCGELLRMKKIFDLSETCKVPLIVLIDEIFKGTNFNDRIFGAKEIVKKLSQLRGIAMITTHDFELCEIDYNRIENYHFTENYEGEKINFDYKIRSGRCQSTNARYLMGQLGLLE